MNVRKFLNSITTHVLFVICLAEAYYVGYKTPHSILPHIDARLLPYMNEFVADAATYGVSVYPESIGMIEFSDQMPTGDVGFCNTASRYWAALGMNHTNVIFINSSIEDDIGTPYFKTIMYHELAHCLLDKSHDEGGSLTIMDPTPYGSDQFWDRTWSQQVKDLFLRPEGDPAPNYHMEIRP